MHSRQIFLDCKLRAVGARTGLSVTRGIRSAVLKRRALDGQHPEAPEEIIAWLEPVMNFWEGL